MRRDFKRILSQIEIINTGIGNKAVLRIKRSRYDFDIMGVFNGIECHGTRLKVKIKREESGVELSFWSNEIEKFNVL